MTDILALEVDASALLHAASAFAVEQAEIERDLLRLTQRRAKLLKEALQRATPRSQPEGDEPEHLPHMADVWHQATIGLAESLVFNDAHYAAFLYTGTSAHWVGPVHAQALHFWSGGEEFFSKGHEVSGIQPNADLVRVIDSQGEKADAELAAYGTELAERVAREAGSQP